MNLSRPPEAAKNPARRSAGRIRIAVVAGVAAVGCVALAVPALASAASHSAHLTANRSVAHSKHATKTTMTAVSGHPDVSIQLAAKVTGGSTPTGTVRFINGSRTLCSANLYRGEAHCEAIFYFQGTDRVKASYGGNSSHLGSAGYATVKLTKATTTTTATVPATHAPGAVTLAAAVKSSDAAYPAGAVTFYNGATKLCSDTKYDGKGNATCSYTFAAGTFHVTAKYGGNAGHDGSASTAHTLTVAAPAAGLVDTATAITNPNPTTQASGVPFDIDVTVTAANGTIPTGEVEVESLAGTGLPADTYTCTFTLTAADDGSGECGITTPAGAYGFVEFEATYEGNATYGTSTSTGEHKLINPIPTTTTVGPATATAGTPVTLTATVTPEDGGNLLAAYSDSPDVVNFTSDGAAIPGCTGVAITDPNGTGSPDGPDIATCSFTPAAGSYDIEATFPGDEYAAPSSGTVTLVAG